MNCAPDVHRPKGSLFLCLLPLLCLGIHSHCAAQNPSPDFGFARTQSVELRDSSGGLYHYAWAGGMNAVRFSEIDLDQDGRKDLFAFEKNGNRILPFLRLPDNTLRYAPEWIHAFPALHDWVILMDYDGDGQEDIFTYGLAGITVYRNRSAGSLSFEKVTDQLMSEYYGNLTNIYASPDDYLAIGDMDGDGDLDILNFWALGMYVHYQKNWAMENFGRLDTFDFKLEDGCWGGFHEGEENNEITLFSDCGNGGAKQSRHVGSTLHLLDYNGDGLMDLALGDMDYPGLVLLTNGGDLDRALMVSQDRNFPNPVDPIHLYAMPAISFIDLDQDGKAELIASPSDPSWKKSENLRSVWRYDFDSATLQYQRTSSSFLQEGMLDVGSGSLPVLYDWDGDGLLDLLVGNFGRYDSSTFIQGFLNSYYSSSITYFRNSGSLESPAFQLVSEDLGHLRRYGFSSLYPAFADFNDDGLTDLLCGNEEGTLTLFLHGGTREDPSFDNYIPNYGGIDVGDNSVPQLFDLDRDGYLDLLVGNRRGHIAYFRNTGDHSQPAFTRVTDTLGGVDVRDFNISYFGYNTPCFFRNGSGETVLFCGNEKGTVFYYKNIDHNLDGEFERVTDELHELEGYTRWILREGMRSTVGVADLNNDGFPELLIGNWAGGIAYFHGMSHPDSTVGVGSVAAEPAVTPYPNPCQSYFRIHCPRDMAEKDPFLLYDLQGRRVLSQTAIPHGNIPVSHLKRGIYIWRMGKESGKLILQ